MSRTTLLRPYITEKTTRLMEEGQYVFVADLKATKPQIRAAVEKHYPGTRVQDVRTMIMPGKSRSQFRRGGRTEGRTSAFKKAIVTVDPDGAQIDFFENI